LALDRIGARVWIPVILIFWGLVATFTAFVRGPESFDAVRFLLGIADPARFPASRST
jgi:MFS transporter, ACS family, tartrate transporter